MAKKELTDTQLTVLQAAARSANLVAWPVPQVLKLNKGSTSIVIKGLLKRGLLEERRALGNDSIWRDGHDGKSLTLVISRVGLDAIGMRDQPDVGEMARAPRAGSKLSILVEMLSRDEGATVEELAAATGWQAHSVRGVMSGTLTKKFGMTIVSQKVEGRGRVYRADSDISIPDGDQAKAGLKGSGR